MYKPENRKPANSDGDKKSFTHNARKVHPKNGLLDRPMRGGFRL